LRDAAQVVKQLDERPAPQPADEPAIAAVA
jgi:hypothetical protein